MEFYRFLYRIYILICKGCNHFVVSSLSRGLWNKICICNLYYSKTLSKLQEIGYLYLLQIQKTSVNEAKQCLSKTTQKLPKSHQQMCPANNVRHEEKVTRLGHAMDGKGTWLKAQTLRLSFAFDANSSWVKLKTKPKTKTKPKKPTPKNQKTHTNNPTKQKKSH